jgi:phosphoribosyl 1,2-cyclic phosphate phosphodiesterase
LKITFLGTGTSQGVPVIACKCEVCRSADPKDSRLRSSVMVQSGETTLVIDSGPDFRQQMLREDAERLDAVVFTHEHKDHVAGLDDVRAFNYFSGKAMDVYATERVQEAIRREFAYIFENSGYPGIPRINLHTLEEQQTFSVKDLEILPVRVMHHRLPVLGFRIGDFSYITDANYIEDKEKEKIKGSKILVLNALRRQKHISHFTLDEALELIRELEPEKAYLTHISHQLGLHEEIEKELPDFIRCGYDGLKVEL